MPSISFPKWSSNLKYQSSKHPRTSSPQNNRSSQRPEQRRGSTSNSYSWKESSNPYSVSTSKGVHQRHEYGQRYPSVLSRTVNDDERRRTIRHATATHCLPTETCVSSKDNTFPEVDEPITVKSVLRLLSALEDVLGSFGPMVVNLMTIAFTMDKHNINSSNQMLDDNDNCVTFETIKEKLKGLLSADVLEPNKTIVVKKAIQNIACLVHEANERQKTCAASGSIPTSSAISDANEYDRDAIAARISLAYINQGKTDVSSAQIKQKTEEYIQMANEQKNSMRNAKNNNDSLLNTLSQQKLNVPVSISSINVPNIKDKEDWVDHLPTTAKSVRIPPPASQQARKEFSTDRPLLVSQSSSTVWKMCPSPSEPDENLEVSLSDWEIKTLMNKVEILSEVEKSQLINFMLNLKKVDPMRFQRLSQFNPSIIGTIHTDKEYRKY